MGPAVGSPSILKKRQKMNSVLRFVKRAVRISGSFKVSHAVNGLMVLGVVGAGLLHTADASSTYGDMGKFIEENILIEPTAGEMGDLGSFIKSLPNDATPVIVVSPSKDPSPQVALSDGRCRRRGSAVCIRWSAMVAVTRLQLRS
jgi:hypothetical protein